MRLIDADAAYKAACEGADNWDGAYSPYRYDRIREEMDKVPTFSSWHRVEDELPNDGEWAIFTNGKVVTVERFKEDAYNHFFPVSQWFDFEDAIAWMPLPEPPKEVQE